MIVSISLEQNAHSAYTNLDVVQGKVYLRVPNPSNLSNIVVKLEGESRTRLMAAVRPDRPDRQRPVLEVHKILYKTQIVWPAGQLPEEVLANPKATYTLNAGQYEFPFQFKIPINNACQTVNSLSTNVNFSNLALEVARSPTRHVKQTLPPSLSGFPGEAEIRYYVKVTVNRPSLFKENPRNIANFTFLPIEPPRPAQTDGEAYARRQHQFMETVPAVPPPGKKKGFFDRKDSSGSMPPVSPLPTTTGPPPRFVVDARLPNPAILTCNKDLPLRILLKSMSPRNKNVYLQMLQIELIGYTKVRAHEVERLESNSWIVASFSNMNIPLGNPTDAVGTEVPINPEYWSGKPLPNTVCPSFQTCNLQRYYELEVRVGLGYGSYKHGEDQLIVLPLRLPVKVYSGIEPPAALLQATLTGATSTSTTTPLPADGKLKPSMSVNTNTNTNLSPPHYAQAPHTPIEQSHSPGFAGPSAFPPAQGAPVAQQAQGTGQGQDPYDDAPPSYEDAIGQDLPPINGYRGNYQPPPVPEGAPRFEDEKRR